jgi:hypothetical protein
MEKRFVDILEKHISYWHQLKFSSSMKYLPTPVMKEMEIVFREHMKSNEPVCYWCMESQVYLVRQVYQTYEREAENPILVNTLKVTVECPNGKPPIENKSVPVADSSLAVDNVQPQGTSEQPKRKRITKTPIYTTKK